MTICKIFLQIHAAILRHLHWKYQEAWSIGKNELIDVTLKLVIETALIH